VNLSALGTVLRADAGRHLVEAEVQPWQNAAVAAVCATALLAVLVLDQVVRPGASFGALTILPVAVAAWILTGWTAVAVVGFGLGIRLVGVALGGVDPLTASADIASLLLVALALSAARRYLTRWRETQAELQSERTRHAALAERERIGAQMPAHEIRVLFGLTLELQAAASDATDEAVRTRITTVIDELDDLVRDLRRLVFSGGASERTRSRDASPVG
jgi:signal transduction histidine kinase